MGTKKPLMREAVGSQRGLAAVPPALSEKPLHRQDGIAMVDEANLISTASGLAPEGDGWFVVNVRDAAWLWREGLVARAGFEAYGRLGVQERLFPEIGIKLGVLEPGKPGTMYHAETAQEDFLVLAGECVAIIEGQERPLRTWDFVHCPGGTRHSFVGAG